MKAKYVVDTTIEYTVESNLERKPDKVIVRSGVSTWVMFDSEAHALESIESGERTAALMFYEERKNNENT